MNNYKTSFIILAIIATTSFISCGSDDDDDNDLESGSSSQTEQSEGLPTGWYNSGALEAVTSNHIQEFLNAGDIGTLKEKIGQTIVLLS